MTENGTQAGRRQVLRGALVVDGTGRPGERADVEVVDGRIGEIGQVDTAGADVVDLDGLVLAPGFVDVHTHFDAQVFWDPNFTPSSTHGITTVIEGNCGFGLAPTRPEHRDIIMETLENVEGMRFPTLKAGIDWSFETFPEYLDAMRRIPKRLNLGAYLGHTPLRTYVMGPDAASEREATDDELARMRALVEEAMAAGAVGVSTSLALTHVGYKGRPVPSRLASKQEITALLEAVGPERGIVQVTYGPPFDIAEVARLSHDLGVRVTWGSLLTTLFGERGVAMEMLERAAREDGDFWPQVSCREIVFQMTMEDPYYFAASPAFSEVLSLPRPERAAKYRDPAWRVRARSEVEKVRPGCFRRASVQETSTHLDIRGRSMEDVAAERGVDPLDLWLDLALAEDLKTRFRVITENDDEVELTQLLQDPRIILGAHDAGAHVDLLCDACFPSHLLSHWVRDRKALTLEEAIWRMSGQPAELFRLRDRGRIATGYHADLVAFDPDTVAAREVERRWDFPANGDRLVSESEGIDSVWVNGTRIRQGGKDIDGVAPGVLVP